jgi:integrase
LDPCFIQNQLLHGLLWSYQKRGNRWYFDFMVRRTRYRGAIPEARTIHQAKQAEARIRSEIFEGKYGQGKSISLKYFIEQIYLPWAESSKLSVETDRYHVQAIVAYFGDMPMRNVSQIQVEKFKNELIVKPTRQKAARKPATVNRGLAVLSRVFSLAREYGYINTNPVSRVRKLREDNLRIRYLTEEEQSRLLDALTGSREWLRPVVVLALNTGMRLGEIASLTWSQVDFERGVITVRRTKTGRDRFVPINDEARDLLTELYSRRQGERVFIEASGRNHNNISTTFARAVERAGIEDFHFHDLRHTAGTRMGEAGADLVTIAAVLGHSDLSMAARYTHPTDRSVRKAVESLSGWQQKNCHKIVTIDRDRKRGAAS